MTLTELYTLIRLDLGEALANNDRVSDTRLLAILNDIYLTRSAELRCFTRADTIASVLDQVTYALDGDICDIRGVRYHTGATPLTRTTEALLAAKTPTYRDTAHGTPEYYYLPDVRTLALYPKPDTGAQDILLDAYTVPYNPMPTGGVAIFTTGTDVPVWPPQFHALLAHDAVYRIATRFKFLGEEMQARAAAAKADADRLALEFTAYVGK